MKKIISWTFSLLTVFSLSAQDIHFSQYNEAPLMLNPALTGFFDGQHRIGLNYKNQWRSIGNAYNTYALSYDARLGSGGNNQSGFLAIGVNVFNDVSGDLNFSNTIGNLNVAYHLKVNDEQMLSAGIYGGFGQRSIDQEGMQWDNQYDGVSGFDPTLASNETFTFQSFGYIDFGFGMNWSLSHNSTNMSSNDGFKTNVGFSISHVNRPSFEFLNNTDERLNMRIAAHAKALIGLSGTNTALVPSILVQFQGTQKEILPGMMVRYTLREQSKYTGFINDAYLSLGGYYRTSDAVIANAMIELNDFAIGLSYDINVSKLSNATNGKGGFEIALRYIISNPNQNRSFY
jgi:type IX secretion system PorP/SprF family membrane protein